MRLVAILLLLFAVSIIQWSFLPLDIVLLIVITAAVIGSGLEVAGVAFFGGLFADLAQGRVIGGSSMLFLLIAFVVYLYRRRFDATHPVFLPFFALFSDLLYRWVTQKNWGLWQAGSLAVLAFLLRCALLYFGRANKEIKVR